MNQAEVMHAGWAHRDRENLSLPDACQADYRDAFLLEVQLKAYKTGHALGGYRPSCAERRKQRFGREMREADEIRKEMFMSGDGGLVIDPASAHCPPAGDEVVIDRTTAKFGKIKYAPYPTSNLALILYLLFQLN